MSRQNRALTKNNFAGMETVLLESRARIRNTISFDFQWTFDTPVFRAVYRERKDRGSEQTTPVVNANEYGANNFCRFWNFRVN